MGRRTDEEQQLAPPQCDFTRVQAGGQNAFPRTRACEDCRRSQVADGGEGGKEAFFSYARLWLFALICPRNISLTDLCRARVDAIESGRLFVLGSGCVSRGRGTDESTRSYVRVPNVIKKLRPGPSFCRADSMAATAD